MMTKTMAKTKWVPLTLTTSATQIYQKASVGWWQWQPSRNYEYAHYEQHAIITNALKQFHPDYDYSFREQFDAISKTTL